MKCRIVLSTSRRGMRRSARICKTEKKLKLRPWHNQLHSKWTFAWTPKLGTSHIKVKHPLFSLVEPVEPNFSYEVNMENHIFYYVLVVSLSNEVNWYWVYECELESWSIMADLRCDLSLHYNITQEIFSYYILLYLVSSQTKTEVGYQSATISKFLHYNVLEK